MAAQAFTSGAPAPPAHRRAACNSNSRNQNRSSRAAVHDWAAPRRSLRCAAENGERSTNSISEDMLARLQKAEEEAARLRQELELAKGGAGSGDPPAPEVPRKRIDGADLRRETLFAVPQNNQRNWLTEGDVEFFTESPAGSGESGVEAGDEAVVRRRLVFGLLAAAGLGAFALVPTEDLSLSKPSKPQFFYLAPLLRAQDLLAEAEGALENGREDELQAILSRVLGPPNNLQDNLRSAAACLPESRAVEAAQAVGREAYEAVLQINPQEYYDVRLADVKVQAQLAKFSLQALKAAQGKLREFLALMPREQVQAAAQANQ